MNDKEIQNIINRNNKIEQNIINQEINIPEKNIITQKNKINPLIEVIDSSRLDENIINLNSNNNYSIYKETIENKESINSIQNTERNNNNINEEPMTFNPNQKINFFDTLNNNMDNNNNDRQNKNFLTFKNEENNNEIKKDDNNYNNMKINDINLDESINKIKLNEENFDINDIITILKKLIDKMKFNLNKNNDNNINNIMINNNMFVNKIKEIKNNVIKIFDNVIEEENLKKNMNDYNSSRYLNSNFNNNIESQFNFHSNNYCLNKKMVEIDEIEKVYKTQIINLKKKINNIEQENNNLKRIIQNSHNILEDLIYKNNLLSSKLIKYKTLYEEKIK